MNNVPRWLEWYATICNLRRMKNYKLYSIPGDFGPFLRRMQTELQQSTDLNFSPPHNRTLTEADWEGGVVTIFGRHAARSLLGQSIEINIRLRNSYNIKKKINCIKYSSQFSVVCIRDAPLNILISIYFTDEPS